MEGLGASGFRLLRVGLASLLCTFYRFREPSFAFSELSVVKVRFVSFIVFACTEIFLRNLRNFVFKIMFNCMPVCFIENTAF